jgi:hypothetical protein
MLSVELRKMPDSNSTRNEDLQIDVQFAAVFSYFLDLSD